MHISHTPIILWEYRWVCLWVFLCLCVARHTRCQRTSAYRWL